MQDRASNSDWGLAVRQRRKLKMLRQDELAALAEVSTRSVHAIETSKSTVRLDVLLAVCSALGLRIQFASPNGDTTVVGHA